MVFMWRFANKEALVNASAKYRQGYFHHMAHCLVFYLSFRDIVI